MKIKNEQIYTMIKKKMIDDLIIAYEVFKEEEHPDLRGVILALNSSGNFGSYLRNNPSKLADFTEYLYNNLDFVVHISFSNDFNDEFFPFIEK
jgi:hypothetical protein